MIVVLTETDLSPDDRYRKYYPDDLPVPVDLWVYTKGEWGELRKRAAGLWDRISEELLDLCDVPVAPQ